MHGWGEAHQAERFKEHRWPILLASVAHDISRHQQAHLEREVSELLLYEAPDPHRNRPSLLRAIETRRHAYRFIAA